MSGGRFILGVGTGHSGVTNVGATTSTPEAFRRGLAFTRSLLAGEPATLDGATTRLPGLARRVPVYAAGSGPAALRTRSKISSIPTDFGM